MLTHRERWHHQLRVDDVRSDEPTLFIGLVVEEEEDGAFQVVVNNRTTPRRAMCSNEFTFETAGSGKGDEVAVLTNDGSNDLAQIVGLSSWSVHG